MVISTLFERAFSQDTEEANCITVHWDGAAQQPTFLITVFP